MTKCWIYLKWLWANLRVMMKKGILKKFLEYQLKKDIEENEGLYMIGNIHSY